MLGSNGAQMLAFVTEVEDVRELLVEAEAAETFSAVIVQRSRVVVRVRDSDATAIGALGPLLARSRCSINGRLEEWSQ